MGLQVQQIAWAVGRADAAMVRLEPVLNESDALIGDADTGSMLARVLAAMAAAPVPAPGDLGLAFSGLARAATSATGSSLGTLLATALMTLAKATKGRDQIDWAEFGALLVAAREAMAARGGARLGDKTVLDALEAVGSAVAGFDESGGSRPATAAQAAHAALDRLRPQACQVGRARMFPQKSAGSDDPGMLAFALLLDALADRSGTPTTP